MNCFAIGVAISGSGRGRRTSCHRLLAIGIVLLVAGIVWLPSLAYGQPGNTRTVPRQDYFLALVAFESGEYNTALSAFRDAARSGVRSVEGRWVDSICYHTMMGECFYQLGDLPRALEQYNAALALMLAHRNWMLRVQFPGDIQPLNRAMRPIPWGSSNRRTVVGNFPDRMLTLQGRPDNERVLMQGGVVAPLQNFPLRVQEIVRCSALALRRRAELMGPVSEHDSLTAELLASLSRRPAPPNHWSQAWVDVQLGLAYVAAGRPAEAINELKKSIQVAGQYDHPLTATALLALGKLAFEQENYDAAGVYFLEATYPAAAFGQFHDIEEAFRWGLMTHLVSGQKGIYSPLVPAAAWARRESRALEASLLVSAAENAAELGNTGQASTLLGQARRSMGRSEMNAGVLGARFQYQTALVSFQGGNLSAGNAAFSNAMTFQRNSSRRLFQIALADKLYTSGQASPRVASAVFDEVLREPTGRDWVVEPMETLGVTMTPHVLPLEHWFESAMQRKELEKALEITDRVRRHRFYTSLAMGGRLLAFRWILEAPPEALSQRARLQRQDLLNKYPRYAELSRRAAAVRGQLTKGALAAHNDEAAKKRSGLVEQLHELSAAQEMILRELALRRQPSEFVFPPLRDVASVRQSLQDRQLVLAYFATSRYLYGFAFGKEQEYGVWQVEAPDKVKPQVMNLLRQMGQFDKNQVLKWDLLRDQGWKEPAAQILEQLTSAADTQSWDNFDEVVIVPDGVLWYLPFETLQVKRGDSSEALISKVRVRYAPTVSLTSPDARPQKALPRTAVVVDKLFPRGTLEESAEAFERLREVLPGVARLPDQLPMASRLLATLCDRLVVLSDIDDSDGAPYGWSPMQLDRGKPGSTLADWMVLPWGGPEQVVLPAYHTAAEHALKRGGSGEEVFLAVSALMATGTRSVLLSRWRTGGQTTYDLVREFVQELPHITAADAWQRSVHLVMESPMDPQREPRVSPPSRPGSLKADHPFFWAGYMVVDTGTQPRAAEEPDVQALDIQQLEQGDAGPENEVPAGDERRP